ncbi:MAG: hypothetical protein KHY19_02485 [Coprobacillus cateniformis]|nr:hypothetical protein [Coprobacillus cateniformis]
MSEMIARIGSDGYTVEIAYKENKIEPLFKRVTISEFIKTLEDSFQSNNNHYKKDINMLNKQIIALDSHFVVVNQPEKQRIVTYVSNGIEAYKINFPNAIYIIETSGDKIKGIECYAYKKYEGENTKLFEYPMPNELVGNHMCIGNADREIKDGNVIEALERIIFTPYSHSTFSGMNGFSQTKAYFEYLEKNDFPYKMMKSLKKKLKDVLKG